MPFLILGCVVILFSILVLAFAHWSYRQAFYFSDKDKKITPRELIAADRHVEYHGEMLRLTDALERHPYEKVSITSRDGLRLSGRYYPVSDSNVLIIFFHGWRSNGLRDACGGAELVRSEGFNYLIVDQRAHGESDGNTITFGIREKYDCADWVAYAVERFGSDVRILLSGISMGASTVLMASALPLPSNVKAITADCSYSSPEAILKKSCRDMHIPAGLGYCFLRLGARLYGGFSLAHDGGAVEAVRHTDIPMLIIHGEADRFVPYPMCHEIFDASAADKYLLTVPDAGHGMSFFGDNPRYIQTVLDFHQKVFG